MAFTPLQEVNSSANLSAPANAAGIIFLKSYLFNFGSFLLAFLLSKPITSYSYFNPSRYSITLIVSDEVFDISVAFMVKKLFTLKNSRFWPLRVRFAFKRTRVSSELALQLCKLPRQLIKSSKYPPLIFL
jgi:hypothetical protein